MAIIENYDEQVYASVLGKIYGVYMGRPFEGWSKAKIEEKWGLIDRYVNEDLGHDLVVADDDITGTFTFVRALADSQEFADTSAEFFGETWMNYLVEHKTILWWGGMGHSTEHTAYLRMKNGIKAPMSGSCALNGKTVSEQIGAQIFIDAIGMCFPGDPDRAALLAERAARVSHDGEAVYAAQIVAVMVAYAFIEKDMNALLDKAMEYIPTDSLMAEIHKDVRAWCVADKDWHQTFKRIDEKYGYHKYGGNCHVVPNHALMVMAWAYAPNDFHESQIIVNTAGWDTDCNAANVGSVMGLVVGLDRINERYDYQSPTADRVLMPTAEGSRGTSDALLEAGYIAEIGRRCMGWPKAEAAKNGAWLHFSQAGAVHGFRSEDTQQLTLANAVSPQRGGERVLQARLHGASNGARFSKPILMRSDAGRSHYGLMGTSRLYSGYTMTAQGFVTGDVQQLRAFIRYDDGDQEQLVYQEAVRQGEAFTLTFVLPDTGSGQIKDFGFELSGVDALLSVDAVDFVATPQVAVQDWIPGDDIPGWVSDKTMVRGKFSDDAEKQMRIGKDEGRGVLITGTTDWTDYSCSARMNIHLASYGGLVVHYQGRERYIALQRTMTGFKLVCQYYQEYVLAECESPAWEVDEFHLLRLDCVGEQITAYCDDVELFSVEDKRLLNGGAGFVFCDGMIGFREFAVVSTLATNAQATAAVPATALV